MSELLPCPFCGGEAQMGINKESTVREYFVGCMNCHIRLYKIGYKRFYTEAEAIAAWNSREERTCHIVKNSRKYVLSDGRELFDDGCSICNGYVGDGDNYCSNCGARVVS